MGRVRRFHVSFLMTPVDSAIRMVVNWLWNRFAIIIRLNSRGPLRERKVPEEGV
jgi:hypothetical protein